MGLFEGTSRAAILNYDETRNCCVPLCTNNFRNFPSLAFYRISKARRIQLRFLSGCLGSTAKKPSALHGAFLWFFSKWNRPRHIFFLQRHILFCFFFSFSSTSRSAISSCFNHAETFHFAFRQVYLRLRPSNNPINARAPSLGPSYQRKWAIHSKTEEW